MSDIQNKNKQNGKGAIKIGIEELKNKQWKFVFLGVYGMVMPFALKYLYLGFDKLFSLVDTNNMGQITLKIHNTMKLAINEGLIPFLAVAGFFVVISWIGKYRFDDPKDDRFLKTKLLNREKEPPIFLYKYKDKSREHGQVLVYDCNGIKKEEFLDQIESLEYVYKKYKIYKVEKFGTDTSNIYIYRIPSKYVKPRIITADDEFLSDLINMLVVGATGTGKSYTLLTILSKIALHIENVSITICDYKNSQIFAPFRNTENYYGDEDVVKGITNFYDELRHRIEEGKAGRYNEQVKILLLDEFSSVIDEFDKQYDLKKKIAYILNMGREYNMRIIVGMQRADSEFFKSGSRDNFRIKLALGNISTEQIKMLGFEKEKMTETNRFLGEGYLHIDGKEIEQVKIAKIDNLDEVNRRILQTMNR